MERTALDLSVTPQTLAKPREGLFANNLKLYISILLVAALTSYAVWARERSIFACQATGYTPDRYIAYCDGANYGDYEHGAFWFGLEPVLGFANKADVLFLGNSHMEKGFSTNATADWFSAAKARYYLMGFSYWENMTFAEALLRKMRPSASVYVINVDDFFDRTERPPAKVVMYDPQGLSQYEAKRFWQHVQQHVCGVFERLCGKKGAIFRSRETGVYYVQNLPGIIPVSFDEGVNPDEVDRDAAAAKDFLQRFTQGKCVVLTQVPTVHTKVGDAKAIAAALGTKETSENNSYVLGFGLGRME
jgi:hypothetical protein